MTTNPETAGVEPVAWMFTSDISERTIFSAKRDNCPRNWIAAPLYAHPSAAREDGEAVNVIRLIASQHPRPEMDGGEPGQRCRHCGYRRKLREPMEHKKNCAYALAVAALATTRPAPEQAPDRNLSASADELIAQAKPLVLPAAPDHANCAVGEGESTPEPTPQQGLGEALVEQVASAMLNASCAETIETARLRAKTVLAAMPTPAAIRAETTAQIVAWLRAGPAVEMTNDIFSDFADAIERGDHLAKDTA